MILLSEKKLKIDFRQRRGKSLFLGQPLGLNQIVINRIDLTEKIKCHRSQRKV